MNIIIIIRLNHYIVKLTVNVGFQVYIVLLDAATLRDDIKLQAMY